MAKRFSEFEHPLTSPPAPLREERGEDFADLNICILQVAFYLKLNVQKFRKATPLSRRRGAGGEVNAMPRPEKSLHLTSSDLYPPAPFSPGERGVDLAKNKQDL
jgi:hypothetical protein